MHGRNGRALLWMAVRLMVLLVVAALVLFYFYEPVPVAVHELRLA